MKYSRIKALSIMLSLFLSTGISFAADSSDQPAPQAQTVDSVPGGLSAQTPLAATQQEALGVVSQPETPASITVIRAMPEPSEIPAQGQPLQQTLPAPSAPAVVSPLESMLSTAANAAASAAIAHAQSHVATDASPQWQGPLSALLGATTPTAPVQTQYPQPTQTASALPWSGPASGVLGTAVSTTATQAQAQIPAVPASWQQMSSSSTTSDAAMSQALTSTFATLFGNPAPSAPASPIQPQTSQPPIMVPASNTGLSPGISPAPAYSQVSQQYCEAGEIAFRAGNLQAAIANFNAALAQDPYCARAYTGLGYTYSWMGDYEKALADYREALARTQNPTDIGRIRRYFTEMLILSGRLDEADYHLRILEAEGQSDSWIPIMRGQYFLRMGNRMVAEYSFGTAQRLNPQEGEKRYQEALDWANRGHYPRALLLYDTAEMLMPGNAGVHYGRAQVYQKMGRKAEAIASYKRYLELDPNSQWAAAARGAIAELEE